MAVLMDRNMQHIAVQRGSVAADCILHFYFNKLVNTLRKRTIRN